MTTLETIRVIATEFADVSDDDISKWIEIAQPLISKRKFGKMYDLALAYLTAHKMKMAGIGDNSMGKVDDSLRVSSYSEGAVSIGFSVSQSNNMTADAEYALTAYGLQYLQIRMSCIIPIVSAGER